MGWDGEEKEHGEAWGGENGMRWREWEWAWGKEHREEGCKSAEEGEVWGGEEADLILHQFLHLA